MVRFIHIWASVPDRPTPETSGIVKKGAPRSAVGGEARASPGAQLLRPSSSGKKKIPVRPDSKVWVSSKGTDPGPTEQGSRAGLRRWHFPACSPGRSGRRRPAAPARTQEAGPDGRRGAEGPTRGRRADGRPGRQHHRPPAPLPPPSPLPLPGPPARAREVRSGAATRVSATDHTFLAQEGEEGLVLLRGEQQGPHVSDPPRRRRLLLAGAHGFAGGVGRPGPSPPASGRALVPFLGDRGGRRVIRGAASRSSAGAGRRPREGGVDSGPRWEREVPAPAGPGSGRRLVVFALRRLR